MFVFFPHIVDAPQCFLNSTRGNLIIRLNKECALTSSMSGSMPPARQNKLDVCQWPTHPHFYFIQFCRKIQKVVRWHGSSWSITEELFFMTVILNKPYWGICKADLLTRSQPWTTRMPKNGPYLFPLKSVGEQQQITWSFYAMLDVLYQDGLPHGKA